MESDKKTSKKFKQNGGGVMGEIADMMLDGTLCQCCGVFIGSNNGYPTYCDSCQLDLEREDKPVVPKKRKKRNHNIFEGRTQKRRWIDDNLD